MKAAGLAAALLVVAACGSSGDGPEVAPVATAAPTDVDTSGPEEEPATTVPATTPPPETSADPVATSSTSIVVLPGVDAASLLATFLAEVDALHAEGVALTDDVAAAVAAGAVGPELYEAGGTLGDRFYALAGRVPAGLHPDVQHAVEAVLFDLGNVLGPFVSAWGWEPTTVADDFGEQIALGVERLPADRRTLDERAAEHPDVVDVAPTSREAAEHALVGLVVGRGLGHQNFLTAPEWSVRWIGSLPGGDAGCTGPLAGEGTYAGDFEPGRGGCGVVFYDTADPYDHEAELAEWLADPGGEPLAVPAEVVTATWDGTTWQVAGSVE